MSTHTHLPLTSAGPAGKEKQLVFSKNCSWGGGGGGGGLNHLHSWLHWGVVVVWWWAFVSFIRVMKVNRSFTCMSSVRFDFLICCFTYRYGSQQTLGRTTWIKKNQNNETNRERNPEIIKLLRWLILIRHKFDSYSNFDLLHFCLLFSFICSFSGTSGLPYNPLHVNCHS